MMTETVKTEPELIVDNCHWSEDVFCYHCGHLSSSLGRLRRHIISNHAEIMYSRDKLFTYALDRNTYTCNICPYECRQKIEIEYHCQKKHFSQKFDENPFYICSIQKTLNIENHRKFSIPKVKPFKCQNCSSQFCRAGSLREHVKSIHLQEKPHHCDLCSYKTSHLGHLKKHVSAVHLKQKPYHCDHCFFKTATLWNIKSHISVVHLQEKPYNCDQCPYRTTKSSYLKRHISSHHLKEEPL